jgi:hypothetical protein
MKVIYKYPIVNFGIGSISMPEGAEILTVQWDDTVGTPCVWAIVDSSSPTFEYRTFEFIGTGHPMPELDFKSRVYIGTIQNNGFVWHVFEHVDKEQ